MAETDEKQPIINWIRRPIVYKGDAPNPAWQRPNGESLTIGTPAGTPGSFAGLHVGHGDDRALCPVDQFSELWEQYGWKVGDQLRFWIRHTGSDEGALHMFVTVGDQSWPADLPVNDELTSYIQLERDNSHVSVVDIPHAYTEPYIILSSTKPGRANSVDVAEVRMSILHEDTGVDDLGIFDGYSDPRQDHVFSWAGNSEDSPSIATYDPSAMPDDPGDGGDDPGDGGDDPGDGGDDPGDGGDDPGDGGDMFNELAKRVAGFMGKAGHNKTETLAREHVEIITAYVYGYTRGRGFDADAIPRYDLRQVIIATTARLTANPTQVHSYTAGDYSERPAVLAGWTLPELAILNNYRRRWA